MPAACTSTPLSPFINYGSDKDTLLIDARNYLGDLATLTNELGTWYTFGISTQIDIDSYSPPEVPPNVDTSVKAPRAVKADQFTPPIPIDLDDAPDFTDSLEIDTSGQPGAAPDYDLGDPPSVPDPIFPSKPGYTVPTVPILNGIDVPNFNPVATIDTSITVPTFNVPDPSTSLDYNETMWTSTDLADMQTHMDRVRNGDFAITEVIWQQIFDRAAMQLRREAITRERAGRRAWAKNGWEMPGGMAAASVEQAAQDVLNATAMKALETAVNEAIQKDDQFWKALKQGVEIETLYSNVWDKYYERQLRFAIALQDALIAVYNALVAKFNAQVAAVRIQVETKRLQIENERLKLDHDRLLLEAAIARGEADKLELQLYIAKWDGIKAMIDAYVAELNGVKTEVDARRLQIEAHGLKVEQWKSRVEAWGIEWQGYSAKMDGEKSKAVVFDSKAKAFGERVRAFGELMDGRIAQSNAEIESAKLVVQDISADVERFAAEWKAQTDQLESRARIGQTNASIYAAKVQGEQTRLQAQVDENRLQLQRDEANQRGDIESARNYVEQLVSEAQLTERIAEALGNIYAQLTSAIYNSYHFNSSVSSSASVSCSSSNIYTCECD